jgi:hypothetical protein
MDDYEWEAFRWGVVCGSLVCVIIFIISRIGI